MDDRTVKENPDLAACVRRLSRLHLERPLQQWAWLAGVREQVQGHTEVWRLMDADKWWFLGAGKFGAAVACSFHGRRVVMKVSRVASTAHCLPPPLDTLCASADRGSPKPTPATGRHLSWKGGVTVAREHAALEILWRLGPVTPHVVQGVAHGVVRLPTRMSVWDFLTSLHTAYMPGSVSRSGSPQLGKPVASLAWSLQEYGGVPLQKVLVSCLSDRERHHGAMPHHPGTPGRSPVAPLFFPQRSGWSTATFETFYRSMLCQVLFGVVHLETAGIHHNDLHTNNVLGTPVDVRYLYYIVRASGAAGGPAGSKGRPTRPFTKKTLQDVLLLEPGASFLRVPTFHVLWRLADFGACTSEAFGPLDHGAMARVWRGGPRWAIRDLFPEVQRAPLHALDAVRFLGSLYRSVASAPHPWGSPAQRTVARRITRHALRRLTTMQPSPRAPAVSVGEAAALPDVPSASPASPALLKEVERLHAASRAQGATRTLLCHIARVAGFVMSPAQSSRQLDAFSDADLQDQVFIL